MNNSDREVNSMKKNESEEKKYRYTLNGTLYFIVLTPEEKDKFEVKYNVLLFEDD